MKQMFQADDGKLFDTAAACQAYEGSNKLLHFVSNNIGGTYNDDAGFEIIEESDVVNFINARIDEIIRIVKGDSTASTSDDGWISNEGNRADYPPDCLELDSFVEVKYRNGSTAQGFAARFRLNWRSIDDHPFDIVAYRIVT